MDINRYAIWVAHVSSLVPPFQEVYTNNSLTKRLFEESGYKVREAPLFDREIYSGTEDQKKDSPWGNVGKACPNSRLRDHT